MRENRGNEETENVVTRVSNVLSSLRREGRKGKGQRKCPPQEKAFSSIFSKLTLSHFHVLSLMRKSVRKRDTQYFPLIFDRHSRLFLLFFPSSILPKSSLSTIFPSSLSAVECFPHNTSLFFSNAWLVYC